MVIALDTNAAIDILNGVQPTVNRILDYTVVYLPSITCGELLFGAENSFKKEENKKRILDLINLSTILNVNLLVSELYAQIRKQLKDLGKPIPENDIWIAATCLAYDVPLATHDVHFQYIPTLKIENWK